jgi:hypothetical protein
LFNNALSKTIAQLLGEAVGGFVSGGGSGGGGGGAGGVLYLTLSGLDTDTCSFVVGLGRAVRCRLR